MKSREPAVAAIALGAALMSSLAVAESPGPQAYPPAVAVASPKDRPYPGQLQILVDATDTERGIVHVHEHLTGAATTLLYPKWLPGHHDPSGTVDRLAGIKITADGRPVAWTRDSADVFTFHVRAAPPPKSLDIDFDYLSPTSGRIGGKEISRDVMMIEWDELVLYPAGYFARQIPVDASLILPDHWQFATALETATTAGTRTTFKRLDLETFVDSPVYAGRYSARLDLDPGSSEPVHLNLFADRPELLAVTPERLAAHRALVQQAYKLFGSHHYAHYDFLYSLSDEIHDNGLEHLQSSEDGSDPTAFTEWDKNAADRDLLAHEFTHSWNGKFRRPADLWTPNYNVPMRDSLLWVYEGQTEYWGDVLAARSALRTRQQALDALALTAAYYEYQPGRQWRSLEDTTNDPIINPRRPAQPWRNWQRFEDYYDEGALIWLDADTLIRERSGGKRSLDDFALKFFGINNGSRVSVTYTFEDVVKALEAVQPYDWAAFLHERLDSVDKPVPLDGLHRGGYKLIYTDQPTDYQKDADAAGNRVDLLFSLGVVIDDKDKKGTILQVLWNGPAFNAKLTEGALILAVNGYSYSPDLLQDAIRAAHAGNSSPIELIVKSGDLYRVARIDYHDGLRYPRLERDGSSPALLDEILSARP
jgi:predicted metalloprotease with PDZ domain